MRPIMICGHAANAQTNDDCVCVICLTKTKMNPQPDLKNRVAKCSYCGQTVPSDSDLPFFEFVSDKMFDSYYCGCKGWD